MISQILQSNWKMKEVGSDNYCNVTLPGSVYSVLLENGLMEDPFYRDNEEEALKLSEKDYEFVTEFDVSEEILQCRMRCLNSLVWIPLQTSGLTENMSAMWTICTGNGSMRSSVC